MSQTLDAKAEERKKKYLEDQKALEQWARGGFSSGTPVLTTPSVSENEKEDDDAE